MNNVKTSICLNKAGLTSGAKTSSGSPHHQSRCRHGIHPGGSWSCLWHNQQLCSQRGLERQSLIMRLAVMSWESGYFCQKRQNTKRRCPWIRAWRLSCNQDSLSWRNGHRSIDHANTSREDIEIWDDATYQICMAFWLIVVTMQGKKWSVSV